MTTRVELLNELAHVAERQPQPNQALLSLLPRRHPIVRTPTGYRFSLHGPSNNAIMLSLLRLGDATPYEPMTTLLTLLTTHNGGTFVDIGANIGYFSLMAARNAALPLMTHAFEPLALNYRCLEMNVKANRLDSTLRAYRVALGDSTDTMELSKYGTGSSLVRGWDQGRADKFGTESVRVVPLDRLLTERGCKPPVVVKIDVEGFDLPVIRGGERFLRSERVGCVMCESSHSHHPDGLNPTAAKQMETLADYGFDCYGVKSSAQGAKNGMSCGLAPFDRVDPADVENWPTNWFCVRSGHPANEALDMLPILFPAFLAAHHRTDAEIQAFIDKLTMGQTGEEAVDKSR